MTRTPVLAPEQMNPEQLRVYEEIKRSRGTWLNGPYAPMLHQPELADKAQALGELLRYRTSLEPVLSEIAILLTARHWDSQFEFYQHEKVALRVGVSQAVCTAIAQGDEPPLANEREEALYAFVSQLLGSHFVAAPEYDRAKALFGVEGVVELTALIGYYSMIAMILNAHEVPLPPDVPPPMPVRTELR